MVSQSLFQPSSFHQVMETTQIMKIGSGQQRINNFQSNSTSKIPVSQPVALGDH